MKVKIKYIKSFHQLVPKRCLIDNKLFIKYNKGNNFCSKECKLKFLQNYYSENYFIKKEERTKDLDKGLSHRKSQVTKRYIRLVNSIKKDLPIIKEKLSFGDDEFIDWFICNYQKKTKKSRYDIIKIKEKL